MYKRQTGLIPYLIGGVAMWYFMSHSGVHATITGVLLAFVIPFGKRTEASPSYILQHMLHKPVALSLIHIFSLDAFLVLSGAVLTSYVGVEGLMKRMALDRIDVYKRQ